MRPTAFAMIEELDKWGIKSRKTRPVTTRCQGAPPGQLRVADARRPPHEAVLYRQLKRARVEITNRVVGTRLLTGPGGEVAGVMGFDCRTADFLRHQGQGRDHLHRCCAASACRRAATLRYLREPDPIPRRHVMAYHAGAELTNLECFQINPLIKDYNGPACAYVTGPSAATPSNNAASPSSSATTGAAR